MTTIRIIDTETTGMEPEEGAQVVEYAYCDLTKVGDLWTVGLPVSKLFYVDLIPPEVRAIHHITMAEVAREADQFFDPDAATMPLGISAVAAHNIEFDAKFIGSFAVPMICTLKAAYRVWPNAPRHSNGVLRYWLEDEGKLSLDHETAMPPHRAGPDTYVTAHILKALFESGATGKEMVAWTKEPRLLPTCPIGKFRDKPWAEVEQGFLSWMLAQPSMEEDLKWNARREIDRRAGRL